MEAILEEKDCPICGEKDQSLHFDPSAERPFHIICKNCGAVPEDPTPEDELEILGISKQEADHLEPSKLEKLKDRKRKLLRYGKNWRETVGS